MSILPIIAPCSDLPMLDIKTWQGVTEPRKQLPQFTGDFGRCYRLNAVDLNAVVMKVRVRFSSIATSVDIRRYIDTLQHPPVPFTWQVAVGEPTSFRVFEHLQGDRT